WFYHLAKKKNIELQFYFYIKAIIIFICIKSSLTNYTNLTKSTALMTMDKILDGKKLADELNSQLKRNIKEAVEEIGFPPKLVTILVGNDEASKVYVNIKHRTCAQVGIDSQSVILDENISQDNLLEEIRELNNDKSVNGILHL
ncbi:unnamed protein product, partial [marine sediment metagenome]